MNLEPFVIIPEQLRAVTRTFRESGFVTWDAALQPDFFGALLIESHRQRREAFWVDWLTDQNGTVLKNGIRGYVGRCARILLFSPGTRQLLKELTGQTLVPSWNASCYTYYGHSGSLLAKHVDKPDECFVTILKIGRAHV